MSDFLEIFGDATYLFSTYVCPIHFVLSTYGLYIHTYPKIGHPIWMLPYELVDKLELKIIHCFHDKSLINDLGHGPHSHGSLKRRSIVNNANLDVNNKKVK